MVASDAVERTLPTRIVSSCACADVSAQRTRAYDEIVLRNFTAIFGSAQPWSVAAILFPAERSESRDPGLHKQRGVLALGPGSRCARPGHERKRLPASVA